MKKSKLKFPKTWIVRGYLNSVMVTNWTITDRFEWEAAAEAEADILKLGNKIDDWSMMAA